MRLVGKALNDRCDELRRFVPAARVRANGIPSAMRLNATDVPLGGLRRTAVARHGRGRARRASSAQRVLRSPTGYLALAKRDQPTCNDTCIARIKDKTASTLPVRKLTKSITAAFATAPIQPSTYTRRK